MPCQNSKGYHPYHPENVVYVTQRQVVKSILGKATNAGKLTVGVKGNQTLRGQLVKGHIIDIMFLRR
ncbi:hypothetical protein GCM10010967_57430 [Dyadobacter beijingensis]|uniref:Uncharacterized protein n=1 Tax=Dyadobacter beijingensis TaxID=365489 RepID=A0ABQ2IKW6_9BACT|nr:hypothetical protein GCM10010967_57430 [Dyadobacter beijingensis]